MYILMKNDLKIKGGCACKLFKKLSSFLVKKKKCLK